jgi:hypothetical protein
MPKTDAGKRRRVANAEMLEGYMDGLDLTTPDASANRSRSYRHGFDRGREDRCVQKPPCSVEQLRRMADEAMAEDDKDALPG